MRLFCGTSCSLPVSSHRSRSRSWDQGLATRSPGSKWPFAASSCSTAGARPQQQASCSLTKIRRSALLSEPIGRGRSQRTMASRSSGSAAALKQFSCAICRIGQGGGRPTPRAPFTRSSGNGPAIRSPCRARSWRGGSISPRCYGPRLSSLSWPRCCARSVFWTDWLSPLVTLTMIADDRERTESLGVNPLGTSF